MRQCIYIYILTYHISITPSECQYNNTIFLNTLDLCESNPCLNGGTCNDNTDHFSCSCLRGYHGRMCDSKGMPVIH